jgi:hypothetical protein
MAKTSMKAALGRNLWRWGEFYGNYLEIWRFPGENFQWESPEIAWR